MNATILKKKWFVTDLSLVLIMGAVGLMLSPLKDVLAFLLGYVLFLTDVYLIAYLASLFVGIRLKETQTMGRGVGVAGVLLGIAKMALLVVCLYLALVVYKLSGLYLAAGALLALLLLTLRWALFYLRAKAQA